MTVVLPRRRFLSLVGLGAAAAGVGIVSEPIRRYWQVGAQLTPRTGMSDEWHRQRLCERAAREAALRPERYDCVTVKHYRRYDTGEVRLTVNDEPWAGRYAEPVRLIGEHGAVDTPTDVVHTLQTFDVYQSDGTPVAAHMTREQLARVVGDEHAAKLWRGRIGPRVTPHEYVKRGTAWLADGQLFVSPADVPRRS
jgi:hypothetical protein